MRSFAVAMMLLAPSLAPAQYGAGMYYPRGPYYGFWTGPAFGYVPAAYGSFWSNGYSLYGPPAPTYGSIPGFFGGSDQRLSDFPDLRYRMWPYNAWGPGFGPGWGPGFGPGWGVGPWVGPGVGVVVPINQPRVEVTQMAGPGVCEVRLPAADAEVFVNGKKVEGTGAVRKLFADLAPRTGTTWQVEARWSGPESIGSAVRSATLRAGELTVVDFTSSGG